MPRSLDAPSSPGDVSEALVSEEARLAVRREWFEQAAALFAARKDDNLQRLARLLDTVLNMATVKAQDEPPTGLSSTERMAQVVNDLNHADLAGHLERAIYGQLYPDGPPTFVEEAYNDLFAMGVVGVALRQGLQQYGGGTASPLVEALSLFEAGGYDLSTVGQRLLMLQHLLGFKLFIRLLGDMGIDFDQSNEALIPFLDSLDEAAIWQRLGEVFDESAPFRQRLLEVMPRLVWGKEMYTLSALTAAGFSALAQAPFVSLRRLYEGIDVHIRKVESSPELLAKLEQDEQFLADRERIRAALEALPADPEESGLLSDRLGRASTGLDRLENEWVNSQKARVQALVAVAMDIFSYMSRSVHSNARGERTDAQDGTPRQAALTGEFNCFTTTWFAAMLLTHKGLIDSRDLNWVTIERSSNGRLALHGALLAKMNQHYYLLDNLHPSGALDMYTYLMSLSKEDKMALCLRNLESRVVDLPDGYPFVEWLDGPQRFRVMSLLPGLTVRLLHHASLNLYEAGDHETAHLAVDLALAITPDCPYLLDLKANLVLDQGNESKAQLLWERAVAEDPLHMWSKWRLAQLYAFQGETALASQYLRDIVEYESEIYQADFIEAARELLTQLEKNPHS